MKLFLAKASKIAEAQSLVVDLHERLPSHIHSPSRLECEYRAKTTGDNYYLLHLKVSGQVEVECRRCLKNYTHDYSNQINLAVCANDKVADRLMEHYECYVHSNYEVDLVDVLTDDMHLFIPEKHSEILDGQCEMIEYEKV